MFRILKKWAQRYALYPIGFAIPRWWSVLLLIYGGYEQQRIDRYVEASAKIKADDSEADVVSILGKPDIRYDKRSKELSALFGSVPRKWVYGSLIYLEYLFVRELPFPNPIPIHFRLFESPDDNDLVIEWSEDDTVLRVVKPKYPKKPKG